MKTSFSVLIPDGDSEFALFAAHCLAHFPNLKLHVLSGKRWAPLRFSRYCDSYTFKRFDPDSATYLDTVAEIVRKHEIDVLLPTETKWLTFAVAHREALSKFVALAPVPEPRAFEIANNKWLLAEFLTQNEIPSPPTVLVTCDAVFQEKLSQMEFPVLLKPVTAWGGDGIERFENLSDLGHFLEQHRREKIKDRFVVQSLLSGFVVGVNVLCRAGKILAATMQRGIIPNTKRYAAAGAIKFIKEDRFLGIAERLVSGLGWSGFANLDTLYDSGEDQLKILEINARFWGSLRGSAIAGVSFPYLACLAALGIPFPKPDYELARYAHPKTALRAGLLRLLGRNQISDFTLQETGLRFLLADPVAETVRAFRQEFLNK
jgi:D-aspartate ligase